MMNRGLIVFSALVIVCSWICGGAAWALQDALGLPMARLLLLPANLIPLAAAFACQHLSRQPGQPFNGLRFGSLGWLLLAWLGGLAWGYLAAVICVGSGLDRFDPSLRSYVAAVLDGPRFYGMEQDYLETYMYLGVRQLYLPPLLHVWFYAAYLCLFTFPLLGWFAKRLAANGAWRAMLVTAVVVSLAAAAAGLPENPALPGALLWQRLLFIAVPGACAIPGAFWLLLRSRSAVVPALALAAVWMALAGALPLVAGGSPLLGLPCGLLPAVLVLLAGIGLWLWQDPGSQQLVVADTAHSGA